MKNKKILALIAAAVLMMSMLCACSSNKTDGATHPADASTSTTAESTSAIIVNPAEMVLKSMTVYERTADGTLVKETAFENIELKERIDENGKKIVYTNYTADAQTQTVTLTINYGHGDEIDMIKGELFNRTKGDTVFKCKYYKDGEMCDFEMPIIFG